MEERARARERESKRESLTWNMTLYCSSGFWTTHMLHPMVTWTQAGWGQTSPGGQYLKIPLFPFGCGSQRELPTDLQVSTPLILGHCGLWIPEVLCPQKQSVSLSLCPVPLFFLVRFQVLPSCSDPYIYKKVLNVFPSVSVPITEYNNLCLSS